MAQSRRKMAEELFQRMRRENPTKFMSLIKLHLSFCVELTSDEMDVIMAVAYDNSNTVLTKINRRETRSSGSFLRKISAFHKARKSTGPFSKLGTFGARLTQEGVAEISQLILFFMQDEKNLLEEGLFRKSGSASRQFELRQMLNYGETVDLTKKYTLHDVASVLKSFLAELPEPLLTDAHFPLYMQIADFIRDEMSRSERSCAKNRQIRLVRLLLILLPMEAVALLHSLLNLLKSVATASDANKMNEENLGKIFGPLLLCPKTLSASALHENAARAAAIIVLMINHCDEIFTIPKEVLKDVLVYYKTCDNVVSTDQTHSSPDIRTTVAFVDQAKSVTDTSKINTDTALAELFAHIQMMPECPQKLKLLKQFQNYNRENLGVNSNLTVTKRSKIATSALRRKISRTKNSFSNLTRHSSRSSFESASSGWSSFSKGVESSFESFDKQSRRSFPSYMSIDAGDISEIELLVTPVAAHQSSARCTVTTEEDAASFCRKSVLRRSCQYNLRKSMEASNICIEKL